MVEVFSLNLHCSLASIFGGHLCPFTLVFVLYRSVKLCFASNFLKNQPVLNYQLLLTIQIISYVNCDVGLMFIQ
jgi:hypothetical protein